MVRRLALVLVLAGVLSLWLMPSSHGTWAAPLTDAERQTVPTRTPTSGPGTPRPATSTREPEVEDTPTLVPPTSTPTMEATATVAPPVEPSPTLASPPGASPSPAGTSPSPTMGAPGAAPAWDFGDAPDPGFPSSEASDGARHAMVAFEWLGEAVDVELDARRVEGDLHDDGIALGELMACTENTLEVRVAVQSREETQHPYDAQHLLYLNVLVDWDGSGSWSGRVWCAEGLFASEWAVRNFPVDVSSWPDGVSSAVVPIELTAGPRTGQVWARFTLSYGEVISGEDWDGRGAFTFGETEDYLVTISVPPSPTPEIGSPMPPAETSPVASPTSVPEEVPGLGGWRFLLCLGSAAVAVVVALLIALYAARKGKLAVVAGVIVVLGLLLAVLFVFYLSDLSRGPDGGGAGTLTRQSPTSEPIVPTVTPTEEPTSETGATVSPSEPLPTPQGQVTPASPVTEEATPDTASPPPAVVATPLPSLMSMKDRFGFGAAISPLDQFAVDRLGAGWYVNWTTEADPLRPYGMEYVQMIRVRDANMSPSGESLERIARQNPGSLWIVGNEPDVPWQDNVTPTEYAAVYHEAYTLLKRVDPTCRVAIAGVSQASPLRLQYLEMILDAYQTLYGERIPVDVWNVHGFILREERGSWGVDIPPGISVDQGRLFELDDHDDMDIFRDQIVTFRRWMEERGEGDKPLIVSEYGILMPAEYGFSEGQVSDFMLATFDFFTTATDATLGYPADGNRLVQRWAWFSLCDTVYPTGNLFDPATGQITTLGLAYGNYTSSH
jgi:hypothetical protein